MNELSSTSVGKFPKTSDAILQMFCDAGIKDYEPHLLLQITDLGHALTKQLLEEAKALSDFAGKKQIDRTDVEFTIKAFEEKYKPNRPSKLFLMDLAAQKNSQPLTPMRQNFGLRLPNDRFCQVQPNFEFSATAANESLTHNVENGVTSYTENTTSSFMNPINNISIENVSNMLADNGSRNGSSNGNIMPMEEDFD